MQKRKEILLKVGKENQIRKPANSVLSINDKTKHNTRKQGLSIIDKPSHNTQKQRNSTLSINDKVKHNTQTAEIRESSKRLDDVSRD